MRPSLVTLLLLLALAAPAVAAHAPERIPCNGVAAGCDDDRVGGVLSRWR